MIRIFKKKKKQYSGAPSGEVKANAFHCTLTSKCGEKGGKKRIFVSFKMYQV